MSKSLIPSVALLAVLPSMGVSADELPVAGVVLGIHGGTGMDKKDMTPAIEKALRAELQRALETGYAILKKPDAGSLDAVEAAIRVLEDSPHFNAGKGAVFTHEGRNELDASIMEGKGKRAGAVGYVTTVKNPITAARAVMEKSKHVLLVGRGAEVFAGKSGLEIVDPSYFRTEERWRQHLQELEKDRQRSPNQDKQGRRRAEPNHVWSTVGAVALDSAGNLAAGTSTGGTLEQTVRPLRRLAHHRRRHLCRQRRLRRFGHRPRRVLHSLRGGLRYRAR